MKDPIGGVWLAQTYDAEPYSGLVVRSQVGSRRESRQYDLHRVETYPENMRPANTAAAHLQFHLRYEPTSFELLTRIFAKTGPDFIQNWITNTPTGQYARRAAFLYEFLTGETLTAPATLGGSYVPALNDKFMITASPDQTTHVPKWRVQDNIPGNRFFCPFIPQFDRLKDAIKVDIAAQYETLMQQFGEDMLIRAATWLTTKESRASFLIEGEANKTDAIQRFTHLLATQTGQGPFPLNDEALAAIQSTILGPNTTIEHFGVRLSPVFVGETTRYQEQLVHYLAPPAGDITAMLDGITTFFHRTKGQSSIMRCAVIAFGFVYIHPLSDGNGRIHRFLINDILRRDGVTPDHVILPVSQTIIGDATSRRAYDQILETVSNPIMEHINHFITFDDEPTLHSDNIRSNIVCEKSCFPSARPAWRFINFAPHTIYLSETLQQTIRQHIAEEARFLTTHHAARKAIKRLIEMPNTDADRLIHSLTQNNFLPSRKLQKEYPKIADLNLWDAIALAVKNALTASP